MRQCAHLVRKASGFRWQIALCMVAWPDRDEREPTIHRTLRGTADNSLSRRDHASQTTARTSVTTDSMFDKQATIPGKPPAPQPPESHFGLCCGSIVLFAALTSEIADFDRRVEPVTCSTDQVSHSGPAMTQCVNTVMNISAHTQVSFFSL